MFIKGHNVTVSWTRKTVAPSRVLSCKTHKDPIVHFGYIVSGIPVIDQGKICKMVFKTELIIVSFYVATTEIGHVQVSSPNDTARENFARRGGRRGRRGGRGDRNDGMS